MVYFFYYKKGISLYKKSINQNLRGRMEPKRKIFEYD